MFDKKAYMQKWRSENKAKIAATKRKEYVNNTASIKARLAKNHKSRYANAETREELLKSSRDHYHTQKNVAIQAYGGKCVECSETDTDVLCLDHINDDGADHRRINGTKIYRWVVKNSFPGGLQVLCLNHNFKKEALRRKASALSPIRNRKLEALKVYGETCAHCDENDTDILQLDHLLGGGVKHAKEVKVNMAQWAKQNGYPKIFQTLCPNCNWRKHLASLRCSSSKSTTLESPDGGRETQDRDTRHRLLP